MAGSGADARLGSFSGYSYWLRICRITAKRARRLSSARITCHGAVAVWVRVRVSRIAALYSCHFARPSTSIRDSFQCLSGSFSRAKKRRSCSARPRLSQIEPDFRQADPILKQHILEPWGLGKKGLALRGRAKPKHMFHNAPIIP